MQNLYAASETNCAGWALHFFLCKLPTLTHIAPVTKDVFSQRIVLVLNMLAVALMLNCTKADAAGRFLSVVEDLPLMGGLAEVEGSALIFSTQQGRIVEVSAKSITGDGIGKGKVLAFYEHTLPQLGWSPAGPLKWVREGERLDLTVTVNGGKLLVQFSLIPL